MKLLIVDDNRYVVEGLKCQIDWKAFGIDELFGCYNVPDAKKILTEHDVDFVICDIEMPGQNGFDLLEWIRQRDSEMEIVLLTSYTDFSYAQKSVSYKVSKYLLKPLDTEQLENTVREMIKQHQIRKKKKQLMEYGNRWISQQSNVKSIFWKNLLGELIPESREYMGAFYHEGDLPYTSKDRLITVLISFNTGAEVWQDEMLCFMCNNALGEISEKSGQYFESVYCIQPEQLVAVFREGGAGAREVRQIMQDFAEFVKVYFQFDVTFHIFEACTPDRLKVYLKDISSICGDNADRGANRLIEPLEHPIAIADYQIPDTQAWKRMIQLGSMDYFQESLAKYFRDQKARGALSKDFVGCLLVDWNLLVSEILRENTAYQSISQLRNNRFSHWLTQDTEELEKLMLEEAKRLSQEINSADDANTLVVKIKKYIREHIDDVNRSQIAEYFYLSPSYLSKRFRRETGESLIEYIQKERINLAKDLLLYSDYSISDIAVQTGYPNFSHFSKQFRKFVGCTPNEFRKNKISRSRQKDDNYDL